jgi:hypothetical protein
MEVCWLVQKDYDPETTVSVDRMKDVASIWGSWQSHRQCQTDNCIVDDFKDANSLIKRNFNFETNLWTHQDNFVSLGRPEALSLHKIGIDKDLQDRDDLVAMALTGARYDLVIALGFDLSYNTALTDALEIHEHKRYLSAVANIIKGFPTTQFVFIDLPAEATENFSKLENFSCDNIQNVLELVSEL